MRSRPSSTASRGDDELEFGEDALLRDARHGSGVAHARGRASRGRGPARAPRPGARGAAPAAGRRRTPAGRPRAAAGRPDRERRRGGRSGRRLPAARAIALTVKSRSARSAWSEPPRNGLRSTCHLRPGPTTRQAPKASESSKAGPRAARPTARAASPASPSSDDVEVVVPRPSSSSRTAPPTSHAGWPASASRTVARASVMPACRRGGRPAARAAAARRSPRS